MSSNIFGVSKLEFSILGVGKLEFDIFGVGKLEFGIETFFVLPSVHLDLICRRGSRGQCYAFANIFTITVLQTVFAISTPSEAIDAHDEIATVNNFK
jgi:hypothetical protein